MNTVADFNKALKAVTGIKTRKVVVYTITQTKDGQWAVHCHGHQVALEATKEIAESWVLFNQ